MNQVFGILKKSVFYKFFKNCYILDCEKKCLKTVGRFRFFVEIIYLHLFFVPSIMNLLNSLTLIGYISKVTLNFYIKSD